MKTLDVVIVWDGLCEPVNPGGYACYGYIIYLGTKDKKTGFGSLGQSPDKTNNIAEWCGLGFALKELARLLENEYKGSSIKTLTILGDSQLVVYQLSGKWQCKSDSMAKYRDRCLELLKVLDPDDFAIRWIPRDMNEEADALSREGYVRASLPHE